MNRCWCWSPAGRFSNILGKQQFLVRSNGSSGRCFSQQRQLVTDGGQGFDYLLVLDFEATCDKRGSTAIKPQEILEFPVLKVDTRTWQTVGTFHRFVRPQIHPVLTPFCTKLTGIIQEMVEDEPPLRTVLDDFHVWLSHENLLIDDDDDDHGEKAINSRNKSKFAFVTCGDWDLKELLPTQLKALGLDVPRYFLSWINIKIIVAQSTGLYPRNLPQMLAHFNLPLQGRLHSGLDDCRNIARVLPVLNKRPKCCWRLTSTSITARD